jgi:alpha-glucosidase/alpha-D-xyloside xylohydrolase
MRTLAACVTAMAIGTVSWADEITSAGGPARLEIRAAGEHSVRVTLMPLGADTELPFTPALAARDYPAPVVRLREIGEPVKATVGSLNVELRPAPLAVIVTTADGEPLQEITFQENGNLTFRKGRRPVLGLGEGGPQPAPRGQRNELPVQFDRNGALHEMVPRWESGAYGSRNPVALMIGTEGWGLFIATPWGEIDLRDDERGLFKPWKPPTGAELPGRDGTARESLQRALQGRPPLGGMIPGAFDLFVFDARDPARLMKDVSLISGPAVMPPKWSLGYMQSHRELVDANLDSEQLLLWVVDTFRERQIPIDAVIYLGTGFTPTGWNTQQPSFQFNPRVFRREPKKVLDDLHDRKVKVIVHMVPWSSRRLPTLHGDIPPREGQTLDASHIQNYWQEHVALVEAGVDAWWPDEGDRFNLFERIKRHQLYYQGPLSTRPDVRPWSLHRNGHLGIARWGGWVWSGDTLSAWKTLEGQIAVGINHSLSLSPYWGSDTGGFYAGVNPPELSGELYTRWFQFSAFCPSFRSHGRIWRLRTPFGWGLADMGSTEGQRFPPDGSELNNPAIEPICKRYAELRYQLIPYTYTLAAEARGTGMPLMRAMWLHYPRDEQARGMGDQYLWGRDLLLAPVYWKGAKSRDVYLPAGAWYDFWTNEMHPGGQTLSRQIDLATMPIYVRAGAIIPFDPLRQYMEQPLDGPTTIRVYTGADGRFRWYEDDGISQAYLNGAFAWTNLVWDNAARRLTIERDTGPDAGTLQVAPRKLLVRLLPENMTRQIDYNGRRAEVSF